MKYHIVTFGCQMNERDSEILAGILEDKKYKYTKILEDADIILFNTCCIREKAEHKAFSSIGKLKKVKKTKPNIIIGVCGCMVQQENKYRDILKSLPHIDFLLGTHNIHELSKTIDEVLDTKQIKINIWDKEGEIIEDLPYRNNSKFKSLINITFGCNNFCTYCIVPYVRGRERSRKLDNIVEQVKYDVDSGVTEIMLLGQNVNSYGKDLEDNVDFADLLEALERIDNLKRIRYMTSHPRDFNDKLINIIAQSEKVCKHYHLPVQSGSNEILKTMNRGYTREDYIELVEKIRKKDSKATITTDIIVGFPGETEKNFQDTVDLVEEIKFDGAYSYLYSKRSGTPAYKYPNQIALKDKKERLYRLNKVINKYNLENNLKYIGTTVEVLVENYNSKTETASGKTSGGKTVLFPGSKELIGSFQKVTILTADTWTLRG